MLTAEEYDLSIYAYLPIGSWRLIAITGETVDHRSHCVDGYFAIARGEL